MTTKRQISPYFILVRIMYIMLNCIHGSILHGAFMQKSGRWCPPFSIKSTVDYKPFVRKTHSTVSHVVISKIPDAKEISAEKAVVATLTTPSLATEITSTGFACGAMIVTLVMAFGAGAAVPFTAGGSGVIAAISLSGTLATGAQCMIGAGRLLAIHNDHGSDVAWLDSQDWYVATTTVLDVISLAAAGTALKGTLETYKLMKAASSSKVTAWFQSLSRAERKRITEEIIKAQNPGISSRGKGRDPRRCLSETFPKRIVTKITAARADECGQQRIGLCGELTHWDYPQSAKYRPVRTLCGWCAAIIFT